jgi:hypothetical protein
MSPDTEKYCLLLAREQKLNVPAVARLTAEFFVAPLPEIAMSLRKGHGFLASALPKIAGLEMQRRLNALGVETVLLPVSALIPLPHPSPIKEMELAPDGLSVHTRIAGPASRIPYAQILFLSVCHILHAAQAHEAAPGSKNLLDTIHKFNLLRSLHESIERSIIRPKPRMETILNIFTKKPRAYYRMSRETVHFGDLGEKKSATARRNFLAVLENLIAKAPAAYVTALTRRFIGREEPGKSAFDDLPEANRYHAWLLNILASR